MAITNFKYEYDYLSNFYNSAVEYEGITYLNNEAAFQAQKTLDITERKKFSILSPSKAKYNGRCLKLRKDWEQVKDEIMYQICLAKFTQNEELKKKLLSTNNEELVEGTTGWHDNYWGNCECDKCKNITGKNQLGKTLMKIREKLKKE